MMEVRGDGRGARGSSAWSGCLVPSLRNRAVGQERSAVVERDDGGLQISVETELAFNELSLRQSVVAAFDDTLRPEWCRVDATINSRAMQIAVDVGGHDAVVRICADAGDEEKSIPLHGQPLLLVDNCFTLHALSAWGAIRRDRSGRDDPGGALYTPLPLGSDLRITCPALQRVSLGGIDLGTPSMTLHLGPDLDEHVWFVDNRVERLAIPRLHVCVDRVAARALDGGRECTIQ